MTVLEMDVDDDGRILSIIFGAKALFIFQLEDLVVEKVYFFDITEPTVLIAELI